MNGWRGALGSPKSFSHLNAMARRIDQVKVLLILAAIEQSIETNTQKLTESTAIENNRVDSFAPPCDRHTTIQKPKMVTQDWSSI